MKSFVSLIGNSSRGAGRLLGLKESQVDSPELVFAEIPDGGWFWVLDEISKYKDLILEGKSELVILWGLTECPLFPEDFTVVGSLNVLLKEVEVRQPEIWKQRKFKLILDGGLFDEDISSLKDCLLAKDIQFYFIPGFRNFVWGKEDCSVERTVNLNVEKGLASTNGKIFIPIRRPDSVRKNLVQTVLANSNIFSQSCLTFNMGFNGNKYHDCEELQVAFNSQNPGFNQEDNGGSFIHEYNFYPVRKKLFSYVVCEHTKYLTEKSYKPMLLAMPALWIGHAGTVKALQAQGFWTFGKWWNEDYDDLEYDDPEKIKKVCDILSQLASMSKKAKKQMYQEMIPTFIHNGLILGTKSKEVEDFIQSEMHKCLV